MSKTFEEKEIEIAIDDVITAVKRQQEEGHEEFTIGDIKQALFEALPFLMERWQRLAIIQNANKK